MRRLPLLLLSTLALGGCALPARAQLVHHLPPPAAPEPELYVPDEFVVVFKGDARRALTASRDARGRIVTSLPAVQALIERTRATDFRRQFVSAVPRSSASRFPDLTGHYLVKLPPGSGLDQAMADFASDPGVDHVERIGIHLVTLTPNDTYYFNPPVSFPYYQWHYQKDDYGIDADLAWDLETGDPSVVVGVLDTGMHTHTYAHVGIILSEGALQFTDPGGKTERVQFKAGSVGFREANATHQVANPGAAPMRVIEVELKR